MRKHPLVPDEHDACGLVAVVERDAAPSRGNVDAALRCLMEMVHRSGNVDGEGDGCGILVDLPRKVWSGHLQRSGYGRAEAEALVADPAFAVLHAFLPHREAPGAHRWKEQALGLLRSSGVEVLLEQWGAVRPDALGPRARMDAPLFWQVAARLDGEVEGPVEARCWELQLRLEAETPWHICSFSPHQVVYKVRGSAQVLPRYYRDLELPEFESRVTIGHNRYSTNTTTVFERVQPFSLLGHNGEINTIQQLREQAAMAGIPLIEGASDSQDLNRTLEGLMHRYGYSLMEAVELCLPPIINEIKHVAPDLQDLYMYYRQVWGPFAQGPVALVSRHGNECVFAVDALGLRPLWCLQSERQIAFSSEQGVVPVGELVEEPKPLAPGEKMAILLRGPEVALLQYHEVQREVLRRTSARVLAPEGYRRFIIPSSPVGADLPAFRVQPGPVPDSTGASDEATPGFFGTGVQERLMAAFGWDAEDVKLVQDMAAKGVEPIGSLGFDGPLAALSHERQNVADYFKESVAVVTNPAIDREREIEHFSTRVVVGPRPPIGRTEARQPKRVELLLPILLGGDRDGDLLPLVDYRELARRHGTYCYEDLQTEFGVGTGKLAVLSATYRRGEPLPTALERLGRMAVDAVLSGAQLLLVGDRQAFTGDRLPIDPHLAVSAVDLALKRHPVGRGAENLRRQVGIVLRSGALRNVHDVMLALGLGADAVNPYLMLEVAAAAGLHNGIDNLLSALKKGIEKVISTIGIHELRGYARLFAAIGLKPELQRWLGTVNYFGSPSSGLGFADLERDAHERYAIATGQARKGLARTFHIYPRIWKAAGEIASGVGTYRAYAERLEALERENPVSLRHVLDLVSDAGGASRPPVPADRVDVSVGRHSLPFLISSMSFGSQGETAFRAYAEAAYRLNMVCLNGEGGEIKDLIGKYPHHRGQQIASGRFGVSSELINSSELVEIKIGQGAKPGEGGHLPGSKVSVKVAAARNARPGVDLISPSNNHDLYSIEDLAQTIEELKTANPNVAVSVKVPVVPGIGTIAVGIAKAGADIVTLSGFDGGTGAARRHALKHVGLPVEIGVREAHQALCEAGIRDRVEIWADGGLKSARDVVKLMLLGANRCGFATLAMVAIGCTICRGCQLDTCHVGIATQVETHEEAQAKGMKRFVPRDYERAVEGLVRLFSAMGQDLRRLTGELGFQRAQDMVGRTDLLVQVRMLHRLDLSELLEPVEARLPAALPVAVGMGSAPAAAGVRLGSSAALGGGHIQAAPPAAARGSEGRSSAAGGRRPVRIVDNPLTHELAAAAETAMRAGQRVVELEGEVVRSPARALGTAVAGAIARRRIYEGVDGEVGARLRFRPGSTPGNGFAAFNVHGVELRVEGGAQDGVGKGAFGGRVVILKGVGKNGRRYNGSVGKSFAYGAMRGLFIVQGDADSRAGIRLSGADVVIGGELRGRVDDSLGNLAARANIKGFAFEYMTNGRAVVLGDPGPWICSGMTGGTVYLRLQPELGFDEAAIRRRIAKGAKVQLSKVGARGRADLHELLGAYVAELKGSGQHELASRYEAILHEVERHFVAVVPMGQQTDPSISTE